jgi:4-hydroxybenzoate polyprenyltransferase
MAGCRFWLFLLAASTGAEGITGYSVWCALALGAYVIGLSYIARRESFNSPVALWPALALAAPVGLALLINNHDYRVRGLLLSAVLAAWIVNCIRHTFWSGERQVGRTVSGLLAGMVLVDLLAVGGGTAWTGLAFCGLFALALLGQRYVPAT